MDDIQGLKNYFKKLKRIIMTEADLKFFRFSFVKKNKIDDVLCCIIATLPKSYKRICMSSQSKDFGSTLSYKILPKAIKRKFFLSPALYSIDRNYAVRLIDTILKTIEKDIQEIEKLNLPE